MAARSSAPGGMGRGRSAVAPRRPKPLDQGPRAGPSVLAACGCRSGHSSVTTTARRDGKGRATGTDLLPLRRLAHDEHRGFAVLQDVGNAARVVDGVQRHRYTQPAARVDWSAHTACRPLGSKIHPGAGATAGRPGPASMGPRVRRSAPSSGSDQAWVAGSNRRYAGRRGQNHRREKSWEGSARRRCRWGSWSSGR